jgi:hypothetical protein
MTSGQDAHTNPLDPGSETYWRLVAIALDPDRSTPELYALMHEGNSDVPLMVNGRIAIFTDPGRAAEVLRTHGAYLPADHIDVARPFAWCDVAGALSYFSDGGIDPNATVLDTVTCSSIWSQRQESRWWTIGVARCTRSLTTAR